MARPFLYVLASLLFATACASEEGAPPDESNIESARINQVTSSLANAKKAEIQALADEFQDVDKAELIAAAKATFGLTGAVATSSSGGAVAESAWSIAGRIFARRAGQAAVLSVADGPLPVGEAIGIGLIVFALVEVGVEVYQMARDTTGVCRCSLRSWQGKSPPASCPARLTIPGFKQGQQAACVAAVRTTLPAECRAHLGHCNVY